MSTKASTPTSNTVPENAISAPEEDYLYTATSGVPNAGLGLFTAITIYKDEIIAEFRGEIISGEEENKRKREGNDDYFMNLHDGTTLDCKNTFCFAKYANDAEGTSLKINAFIGMDEHHRVCLIANKTIKAGSEIFCSYGKKYWKKRSHYLQK